MGADQAGDRGATGMTAPRELDSNGRTCPKTAICQSSQHGLGAAIRDNAEALHSGELGRVPQLSACAGSQAFPFARSSLARGGGKLTVDIAEWLQGLGLGRYGSAFAENAINWDVLPELTADASTAAE